MKYSELNELWSRQEKLFTEWRSGLLTEAAALRSHLCEKIESPKTWIEFGTKKQRQYVALKDINEENTGSVLQMDTNAFSDLGELYFGVSITFDHGVDVHPKAVNYVSVAIRYENGIVQYCLWDSGRRAMIDGEQWSADKEAFLERVIGVFEKSLKFDPKTGFENKPKIGFV